MSVSKKARNVPKQFLGAFKKGHRVSVREFIDEEMSWQLLNRIENSNYTDTEAIQALEYITRFNNEFHKNVIKKGDVNALHNTDELRRDLYSRENSKNRDLASIGNRDELTVTGKSSQNHEKDGASDAVTYSQDLDYMLDDSVNHMEDALIDYLDEKYHSEDSES